MLCATLETWVHAAEDAKAKRLEAIHAQAIESKKDVQQDGLEGSEDELPSQSYHHRQHDQHRPYPADDKSRLRWEQEKAVLVLRSLAAEMRRVEEQQARDEDSLQHEALANALAAQRRRSKVMKKRVHQARGQVPAQPRLVRRSATTLQHWAERGSRHGKARAQHPHTAVAPVGSLDQRQDCVLAGRSVETLDQWARASARRNESTGRTHTCG